MRVSREQMAENRRKVIEAAGRLFRERGYEAVTVAEVMKAAGLTHGAFYGYFESKDALIAAVLADLLSGAGTAPASLSDAAARYLTESHRRDRADGCPVAALATETVRQPAPARAAMTASLRRQIERLSAVSQAGDAAARRRAAIGGWAAMVGGLVLARLSDDPALAEEVLAQTRAWIAQGDAPEA